MPVTRSQAQRSEEFKQLIGILFPTNNPDMNTRTGATLDQSLKIMIEKFMEKQNVQGVYYAIQLYKPESIRLHDPLLGEQYISCSCGEFKLAGGCIHIQVSTTKLINKS